MALPGQGFEEIAVREDGPDLHLAESRKKLAGLCDRVSLCARAFKVAGINVTQGHQRPKAKQSVARPQHESD
jgi:hypothetical protein